MRREMVLMDKPGRRKLVVPFTKEGDEVEVLGLILGYKQGDYELDVTANHLAGRTKGRVEVRGVAKNGARLRVNGMINIATNAQNVEDFLEMRLLILDDKSQAVAEPKLEIMANEVRASHAASVGRIDEEQVYYLQSRGISRKSAEEMIVQGFLKSITNRMHNEVQL